MSFGPMKAMLTGWSRPETAVRTARFGSTTLGAAAAPPGRTSTAARASGSTRMRSALVMSPLLVVDQTLVGGTRVLSLRIERLGGERGESGRWDSNPRPSAWEADALPTELRP